MGASSTKSSPRIVESRASEIRYGAVSWIDWFSSFRDRIKTCFFKYNFLSVGVESEFKYSYRYHHQ